MVLLMWDRNVGVESMITPRFRTSGDGEVEQPSMTRARSPTFFSSGAGATSATMSSVLLLFRSKSSKF